MENKKRKRKSSILYLFLVSFTFIIVAICLILTNILVKNTNPNITLIKTIDVILAFSFLIIAFIILKSIYKDLIYYKIVRKSNQIKKAAIHFISSYDKDKLLCYLDNSSVRKEGFYVITEEARLRGRLNYYIYLSDSTDLSLKEKVDLFRATSKNDDKAVLILLLSDFKLDNDLLDRINSYDKSYYMQEYLSKARMNQILMVADEITIHV